MRTWFILAIMGLSSLAYAADPVPTAEGKLELRKTTIILPECPPTVAYILETDYQEITFIPPHESHVRLDGTNREVRFSYRDDRCLIILKHSDVSPGLVSPAGWDKLRNIVKERYPDAEVSEGSVCLNSCGTEGCGFTIRQKTGLRSVKLVTRLSFIPMEGGTLEISLTANSNKFAAQEFCYHSFLNCLRLEKQSEPKTGLVKN